MNNEQFERDFDAAAEKREAQRIKTGADLEPHLAGPTATDGETDNEKLAEKLFYLVYRSVRSFMFDRKAKLAEVAFPDCPVHHQAVTFGAVNGSESWRAACPRNDETP
jgi:hypothetical protein